MKNKGALRELSYFLFFGTLTTVIAWTVFFGVLWLGENVLLIPGDSNVFYTVRIAAQILQWIIAVLFAFTTNKKWVFKNADNSMPVLNQLMRFAAARLITLGIDASITFGTVWILQRLDYHDISLGFVGFENFSLSADFVAKMLASFFVLISNYVFSKLFVFKATKQCKNK